MKGLSISEVARQIGIKASTIRYYEEIGLLLPPERVGGQRRYDHSVLRRLAVIQRARQTGFSLDEIRRLLFGFRGDTPPSVRWQKMAGQKLAELESLADDIKTMQRLLKKLQSCQCAALDECGEKLLQYPSSDLAVNPSFWKPRHRN